MAIVWRCLRDPMFSSFSGTPTCDGRTDRQTDTRLHLIPALASVARVKILLLLGPHCSTVYLDATYCYSSVVCRSVGLLVCNDCGPCKNCWIDQHVVWFVDSGGPKEACIRWGCTLAHPGEYDWTVHVRRRCSLFVKLVWHLLPL